MRRLSVLDVVCRPVSPAQHVGDTHAYARRTCGQVVACRTAVGEEVRLPPRLSHFSTVSIDSHGWQAAATFLPATGVLDTTKAPPLLPTCRAGETGLQTTSCTLRRHIPGRAHHPGNRVMRTTTGVPAATHTAVSSMRKAYQPGPLPSVAQAAPRYRSGGAQKVRGVA
eukprot:COSAG01_NODE_1146_length_11522_cov_103.027916_6_plen_168_part_00